MATKIIGKGPAVRDEFLNGIDALSIVASTLGPKGRNVVIEQSFGAPKITKDGVTVAKSISLPEKFRDMAVKILIEAANKSNDNAGDGTTTTVVLAMALIREGIRQVAAGANPMDLSRGMKLHKLLQFLLMAMLISAINLLRLLKK
jgi:chaperonin GroEL